MTKNSLKVYSNNFLLVWKQMLFLVCFMAIISIMVIALALPIVNVISNSGWFTQLKDFFETIYTEPAVLAKEVTALATQLWVVLKANVNLVWGSYLGILILIFLLSNFGIKISQYTIAEILNGKMQSLTIHRYTSKLISSLKRSTIYSLVAMLIELPFFILIIAFGYVYGIMANNWLSATLLLPLLSIVIIAICGFRNALFSTFLPNMVASSSGVFRCLVTGIKSLKGHFSTVISSSILLSIIMFGGTIIISLFTLGAGLLICLPSISVIKCSYMLVTKMSIEKQRFYINDTTIVTPL